MIAASQTSSHGEVTPQRASEIPPAGGMALLDYLQQLRAFSGADAIQCVRLAQQVSVLAADVPTEAIGKNLARTAAGVSELRDRSRVVVKSFRFDNRQVHLVAAPYAEDCWLLLWKRVGDENAARALGILAGWAARTLPDGEALPIGTHGLLEILEADTGRLVRFEQVAGWVTSHTGAERVYLAERQRRGWRVVYPKSLARQATSPIDQAVGFVLRHDGDAPALQELAALCDAEVSRLVEVGERHRLVLVGPETIKVPGDDVVGHLTLLLDLIAPPGAVARVGRGLARRARGRGLQLACLCSLLVAGCLAIPVPFQVKADVSFEASVRRFIVAPFSGVLRSMHVRSGDAVAVGDLVAELDGREITERLAALTAKLSAASLETASQLEASNYNQATIGSLDVESLRHELALLRHYQKNLQLRSPVDGIVIGGDLERAEGAAVELGKPLLEVAPLDPMVAEVAVDERDIALVQTGMQVEMQLRAAPDEKLSGPVRAITPQAETRDGKLVFIAEVDVPNADGLLRPGMKGKGVVSAERAPLGWVLIRKPWHMLRRWLF